MQRGRCLRRVTERGRILELSQPGGQEFRALAPPIQFPGETNDTGPAPTLGGDTEALLDELGYDADTRARLRETGVG